MHPKESPRQQILHTSVNIAHHSPERLTSLRLEMGKRYAADPLFCKECYCASKCSSFKGNQLLSNGAYQVAGAHHPLWDCPIQTHC